MKKQFLSLFFLCLCTLGVHGQSEETPSARKVTQYQGPEVTKFSVEGRFGWQMFRTSGVTEDDRTGFRGEFFNLRLDARLYKGLSFSWRQRLNITSERNFWNSTDWMVLNYAPNKDWLISAGKQVVAIGGYEYDRPPIDIYNSNSEYWNHIGCYQFGASVAYNFSKDDRLTFQFCNSPFRTDIGNNNNYGFSLMWNGSHGMWETIWSVNAFQCTGGRWMNYIALGNKFNFLPQRMWLELDYVNRASSHQTFLFEDCSVIAEMSGKPHSTVRMFAKYTYDVNNTGTDADLYVMSGTEMHGVSGGIEYEPFKKHPEVLRLFGSCGYTWGVNTNPNGAMKDGQIRLNVGAKIHLDLLKGLKWALNKW
jgi:hypothetical protein